MATKQETLNQAQRPQAKNAKQSSLLKSGDIFDDIFGGTYKIPDTGKLLPQKECSEQKSGGCYSALREIEPALERADVLLKLACDLTLRQAPSVSRQRALAVLAEVDNLIQDATHEIYATGIEF